jgi:hypothetical protein
MRPRVIGFTLAVVLGAAFTLAQAQSWRPPADAQRCPSKWGATDERGSGNHIKPETVMRGVRLIRTGEVIELGHVRSATILISSTRTGAAATRSCSWSTGFTCWRT